MNATEELPTSRGVLQASAQEDRALLQELTDDQVNCFDIMAQRIKWDERENYRASVSSEQLRALFDAQSQVVAKVAFQIWRGAIRFAGEQLRMNKSPEILHKIIKESEHVRELAFQCLFLGNIDTRYHARGDLTREWITKYPDQAELAFQAMQKFKLQGRMLEFFTSDMYRTSPYRIRTAQIVLNWSVNWTHIKENSNRSYVKESVEERIKLLFIIRDTIPQLRAKADLQIRTLLRQGRTHFDSGQSNNNTIVHYVPWYEEIGTRHPEYELETWEVMSDTSPGNIRYEEEYSIYLQRMWDRCPERQNTIFAIATLSPDTTPCWCKRVQVKFLQHIWEIDPPRREAILDFYEAHRGNREFSDCLDQIWTNHPEYRTRLYNLRKQDCTKEWDLRALYRKAMTCENIDPEIYQEAKQGIRPYLREEENHKGKVGSYRRMWMHKFPAERQQIWGWAKGKTPSRNLLINTMQEFPDLAFDCIDELDQINRDEQKRAQKKEDLKHSTSSYYSYRDPEEYLTLSALLVEDKAALYPCDRIAQTLFDSIGSEKIEPHIDESTRRKALTKIILSPQVSIPLQTQAWNRITTTYESYGKQTLDWSRIWEVGGSNSIFAPDAVRLIYQNRSDNWKQKWDRDDILTFIRMSDGFMRQEMFEHLLQHERTTQAQLSQLAADVPELAPQIEAHELPSVDAVVEGLKNL